MPIRVERVAEVTFGQLEKRRFRHGVSFVRWRPDREPASCRYDQLDVADPVPFSDLVDPGLSPSECELVCDLSRTRHSDERQSRSSSARRSSSRR